MVFKIAISLSLASLAAGASHSAVPSRAEQAGLAPATIAAIDAAVGDFVSRKLVPGAAVGISRNGRILLVRGYGIADLEHRAPVIAETVFYTGSMGKQMTAAGILMLAERGRLSVDDPLAKYLPDVPRSSEVTLRQLLGHTAGLRDYVDGNFIGKSASRIDRDRDELLRFVLDTDKPYNFDPGTSWEYSNTNFVLLGAVIEKATGQSYASFLKTHLFDPLGMKDTAVDDPTEVVPDRARGYRKGRTPNTFKNAEFLALTNLYAAGSLRSTARDLLIWEDALLDGKVISAKSVALMMATARLNDGRPMSETPEGRRMPFTYGFGSITAEPVAGRRAIGNGGFMPGFNTWVRRLPDDGVTLVVLTNMTGQARDIGAKLVNAVLGAQTEGNRREESASRQP